VQPDHVKVLLECTRRRESMNLYVRVRRGVPPELRCQPGGGGVSLGTGNPLCEKCQSLLRDGLGEVVDDLTRRGWSEHVKAGAVMVAC
jgi:hypothetical protein